VAAPVEGRVLEERLTIGREVRAGDLLVALDAEAERLAIEEHHARIAALAARREAIGREIRAGQDALTVQVGARAEARAEAKALVLEAEARARAAEYQAIASARLRRSNAVSEETLRKDEAEAEARRAQARALVLAVTRGEQDRLAQEGDRRTRLAGLERERAEIEGEAAIAEAAIRTLRNEVERRLIRAPVSGRVGESAEFRPGAVVRAAERLGAVVPPGRPRVVAAFPAASVGRIRPGQPAWVRLEGFPWTQYGALAARVADVGNEPSEGRVRVELVLAPGRASPIPLGHGLPGSAEVEVERVSPAVLALRAAGQYLATVPEGRREGRGEP
jgi:membrane fusion protein (multidrug efflux system)